MDLRIGVLGATGALGKEIVGVLDRTTWRPDEIVPIASPGTTHPFVEYGSSQVAVEGLDTCDVPELDALIIAAPQNVVADVAREAIRSGVPIVDCSGLLKTNEEAPCLVPWVNPEMLAEGIHRGAIAVPDAASILLSSVIGPLLRSGIIGEFQATLLYPASHAGRGGMEELSKQVISLFNAGTPPRKVFEHGLAFDIIPQMGPVDENGWSDVETEVVATVQQMLRTPIPISLSAMMVPVFSGLSADIHLRTTKRVMPDLVKQVLQDGGLKMTEVPSPGTEPRPRRVEGEPFVHCGRVRTDSEGHHLHLWAGMDNLRATATVSVGCCAALLREEIEAAKKDQSQAE